MTECITTQTSQRKSKGKNFHEKLARIQQENWKLMISKNQENPKTTPNEPVLTKDKTKIKKKITHKQR